MQKQVLLRSMELIPSQARTVYKCGQVTPQEKGMVGASTDIGKISIFPLMPLMYPAAKLDQAASPDFESDHECVFVRGIDNP